MKIIYKKGDICDAEERYIAHGCNARGVMGSGVAKALRNRWPKVYESYHRVYIEQGLEVGAVHITTVQSDKIVCNCITQRYYGHDGERYLSYTGLTNCMRTLNVIIGDSAIAMPKIGAGLAGGDWEIIKGIIESELKRAQAVVYEL